MERLREIQASVRGLQIDLTANQGRRLVKEGPIKKVSHGKAQMRHFFLFSDMILYCRATRGRKKLEYKGHFSLLETLIAPHPDNRLYKYAFEVVRMDGKKRRYILAFPNQQEMEEWQILIEQLISRQQNKAKRQSDVKAAEQHELESKQATHRRRAAQQKALKQGCDDIYDAAYQGNVKMLEAFIKSGAPVNGYDEEGWTPLMNAALHGHLECVNLLLSAGADPHLVDDQKQTCLHKAAYHAGKSAIVEALLAKGCPVNAQESFGCTALHYAATYSDVETCRAIIAHSGNVNLADNTGGTPLHYACRVSNGYVAELLLKEGADLRAKDSDRLTPIYQASFFGHDQIVKLLLQYYTPEQNAKKKKKAIKEPTACDNIQGVSPLHCAALMGHLSVVEVLYDYEPVVDVRDKQNATPLHKACKRDQSHVAEFFIRKGADLNAKTTAGETPLLVACAGGAVRCVELLLSKGCDMDAVDSQGRGPLHHAVESGSYEAVMWVMEECRDVSPQDTAGVTPLHIAIEHDYMDIAKLLMEQGNASTSGCVHVAAHYDRNVFLNMLLDMGAPINELNREGETPLQVAYKMGNAKASKALIRRGAVMPETESDAEGQIRDMFLISAFEEIQIPINSVYGARVWDIVERFAKHLSGALKTMDDEEEELRKDNRGKEVGSQAHWARKLDKLEEDLSFLFPDWQQEEVEQAFFYPEVETVQNSDNPAAVGDVSAAGVEGPLTAGTPLSPKSNNSTAGGRVQQQDLNRTLEILPDPAQAGEDSSSAPAAPPAPAPPPSPSPGPMDGPPKPQGQDRKMLKRLLWRKIPGAKLDTAFWGEVSKSAQIKLDEAHIEKLFRREAHKGKDKAQKKDEGEILRLLDPNRARNIIIVASRLQATPAQVKQAVWSLDMNLLTMDRVNILLKTIPTDAEMELIGQHAHDPVRLGQAEQFCLELMSVPRLRQRLQCVLVRLEFTETLRELQADINSVVTVCHQMLTNKKFKAVLGCVLAVGNFLNAGSFVGDAEGFTADSLLKIVDVTSTKGSKHSLMDYITNMLLKTNPSAVSFPHDLRHAKAAAQERVAAIPTTMQTLAQGLAMIAEELEQAWDQEPLRRTFPGFLAEAQKELAALKEPVAQYQANYASLLRIFGEDPKTPINDFFRGFHKFITAFQKCQEDIATKRLRQQQAQINDSRTGMVAELKDKIAAGQLSTSTVVKSMRRRAPTTSLLIA